MAPAPTTREGRRQELLRRGLFSEAAIQRILALEFGGREGDTDSSDIDSSDSDNSESSGSTITADDRR